MMTTIQSYVRRGRQQLRSWALNPRVHVLAETLGCALAGMLLSAASLGNIPMPLTLGLLCAAEGWRGTLVGLGGCVGYLLFWSDAGLQGVLWMLCGLAAMLCLGSSRLAGEQKLLMPAIAALIVSAGGVVFQLWMGDETPVPLYLLRVLLGSGSTWVFARVRERLSPSADWLAWGMAVLALAQVAPVPWMGFGFVAAGFLCVGGPFPAAALAGLALDLARVTPVPMTAVLCLGCLTKLLPKGPGWLPGAAVSVGYLGIMGLTGQWDMNPLPGLLLGAVVGYLIPQRGNRLPRRGETGVAQVRLELAAGVFAQTEQLLLETPEQPLDEASLVLRAVQRACESCPCRKNCKDQERVQEISPGLLRHCLLRSEDLPVSCKKSGRILQEMRRSQETLRGLRANRDRIRECRSAVIQQYRFLAEYLQDLSDRLVQRPEQTAPRFRPEISAVSASRESADGDRAVWFAGVGCRYYVLLCDGMGTGLGAAQESRDAISMLQKLLEAGFPASYALRSLNSLCALRGRAGAVSVDLAELQLDTGKGLLYKWGGAPSWLLGNGVTEKIGTAGPPPGLSVTDGRETVERLSLRRGETLILLSDGVDGEEIPHRAGEWEELPPGELADAILEQGRGEETDDATAVVIRLIPAAMST